MKRIVLIRHAKSSYPVGIHDCHRPLSQEGELAAKRVAACAASFFVGAPLIYCSHAQRTMDTAELFKTFMPEAFAHFEVREDLYTFDMRVLLQIVKSAPNTYNALIIFGHNEAITDFVNTFGDRYIANVPTAGLVEIACEASSWKAISKGVTSACLFPKLLAT